MEQLTLEFLTEAEPEMAFPADTAGNGVEGQSTTFPPGCSFHYQVNGPGDIPDALAMFQNRFGIPARLMVWPGCEFSSDGLKVESSQLMAKGWIGVS